MSIISGTQMENQYIKSYIDSLDHDDYHLNKKEGKYEDIVCPKCGFRFNKWIFSWIKKKKEN